MSFKKSLIILVMVFLFVIFIIITTEVLLRLKIRITEKGPSRYLDYGDVYKAGIDNWAKGGKLKEGFKGWVIDGYGGKVWWENNSDGFRSSREYTAYPPCGVLRILSMGDSFTAGYRVGQHETFSYLLERWLNDIYIKSEVLISDVEDPVKGFYYLNNYGYLFHPHVIILGITLGNDLTQAYIGLDPQGTYSIVTDGEDIKIVKNKFFDNTRFFQRLKKYEIPEGCLKQHKHTVKKRWMDIINLLQDNSMIFKRVMDRLSINKPQAIVSWFGEYTRPKLFDGVNGLGIYLNPYPSEIAIAYQRLFRILSAYESFCKTRGITLIITLFPQRFQIQQGDWEKTVQTYGLNETCFDTMLPNKVIMEFCRQKGLNCIDPTLKMQEQYEKIGKSLYLPKGDMHWNRLGHKAYFEAAREEFLEIIQRNKIRPTC
jgi:hypothetical protein